VILTAYLREWIGAKTSCLSLRRGLLEKILPLPFAEDWRTRADDCLIFGASLAGARKYFLAQPLVRYRVHDTNHFRGRAPDKHALYRRRLAINRLFEHLQRKFSLDVARLGDFHHREFATIAKPGFRQFRQYLKINAASRISPFRRLSCLAEMTRHYLQSAFDRNAGTALAEDDVDAPLLLRMLLADDVEMPGAARAPRRRHPAA
jgi:hypothetical protein